MKITKNILLQGKHNKPILVDVFYQENNQPKPVLIFCHGYKGYKDWGAWNVMAKEFANAGFFFLKFNFSHNGGTEKNPIDFPDLEAFGNNNFIKELDDLHTVIDWVTTTNEFDAEKDNQQLNLMGHSRGGGIVLLKSAEDIRIKKVITLAGVSDFKSRFPTGDLLKKWQKDGVQYVLNGRTKQQMPHFYQFYTNFIDNEERLTIQKAVSTLKIPHLIIHGDDDTSVQIDEAKNLHCWNPKSKLAIIDGANHVFATQHPWTKPQLSSDLQKATDSSVEFLKNS